MIDLLKQEFYKLIHQKKYFGFTDCSPWVDVICWIGNN